MMMVARKRPNVLDSERLEITWSRDRYHTIALLLSCYRIIVLFHHYHYIVATSSSRYRKSASSSSQHQFIVTAKSNQRSIDPNIDCAMMWFWTTWPYQNFILQCNYFWYNFTIKKMWVVHSKKYSNLFWYKIAWKPELVTTSYRQDI